MFVDVRGMWMRRWSEASKGWSCPAPGSHRSNTQATVVPFTLLSCRFQATWASAIIPHPMGQSCRKSGVTPLSVAPEWIWSASNHMFGAQRMQQTTHNTCTKHKTHTHDTHTPMHITRHNTHTHTQHTTNRTETTQHAQLTIHSHVGHRPYILDSRSLQIALKSHTKQKTQSRQKGQSGQSRRNAQKAPPKNNTRNRPINGAKTPKNTQHEPSPGPDPKQASC